jgi:hypothetical protein
MQHLLGEEKCVLDNDLQSRSLHFGGPMLAKILRPLPLPMAAANSVDYVAESLHTKIGTDEGRKNKIVIVHFVHKNRAKITRT